MSLRHHVPAGASGPQTAGARARSRELGLALERRASARGVREAIHAFVRVAAHALDVPIAVVHLVLEGDVLEASWRAPGLTRDVTGDALEGVLCSLVEEAGAPPVEEDLRASRLPAEVVAVACWTRALLGFPLVADDGSIRGVVCLADTAPRRWSTEDVTLVAELAALLRAELDRPPAGESPIALLVPAQEGAAAEPELNEDPCFSFVLDLDGRFAFVSGAVERVLGYTAEELEGLPCGEVLPGLIPESGSGPAPGRGAGLVQRLVSIAALDRAGQEVPVQVLVSATSRKGRLESVQGLARDVSRRGHADARCAAVEAHYRRLVETSPYGIYVLDVQGVFTELNAAAAEVLGRSCEEVLGCTFHQFVAPEQFDEVGALFREQTAGLSDRNELEFEVVRPGGERRLVHIRSTAIRDGDAVVGVHGVGRDITDERAREAQLRRAERLSSLGTLLSGVAHELNNPLTSIKSFSQLMLLDDRSAEDQESLEVIQREAERATRIVGDLRLIAQQSKAGDVKRTALDLNEIVRRALEMTRYSMDGDGIELREDLTRDPLPIWGNEERLQQMVMNLLVNARLAVASSPGDARIIVRTRPSRRGLALAVIDSGRGIAPEHLDRIFDPFWTTREPGEGTGLGLSVVHGIVVEHGGEIRVESELGKGTAFTVDLPWSSPVAERIPPAERAEVTKRQLRILLVEDELPIRMSLARFLERRGHTVDDAEHGRRALQLLDERPSYDLIVSDLRMPGLSGEELFDRLRARNEALEKRVVFMTGDAVSPDAEEFLLSSGAPVVLKPFALAEVADMLERYAARSADEEG
jgi:PAS domain S-box-containing protein